jgi:methyltransferase (TIGR00027 family)
VTGTLQPVSRTAYYCCGVRALDAASPRPVCDDYLAERFMTPEAWAVFEPFRDLKGPNISNVARHRMIDDLLRERLARHPDGGVVIIGAGFDTRAFRLPAGQWVELDAPSLVAEKEARLPAVEAPNRLTRVPIVFDAEPLDAALAPFRHLPEPVVVLEGVLPYVAAADVERLLRVVRETFTSPDLICDLTTSAFVRRYSGPIAERLRTLGAPYGRLDREPLELLEAAGFRLTSRASVVGHAASHGVLTIPRWMLATILRTLRDGYTIATFESAVPAK